MKIVSIFVAFFENMNFKTSHHDKVTIQWSKKEEDKTG